MYTAVLMLAMTTGADTPDFGRRGCNGCSANYSYGCHGGCHSGYSSGCCGGGNYRSGYYSNYSYLPRTYYASGYYYSNGVAQVPSVESRPSFYFDPNQPSPAMIRILVPNPEAEIWFDNAPTSQRGMERMFSSPVLEPGKYKYTIKARWMESGRPVEQERNVEVRPGGEPITVDFRVNAPESLPNPKGSLPKPLPNPSPKDKANLK